MNQKTVSEESGSSRTEDPGLNRVIKRNISKILQFRAKAAHRRTVQERIADAITDFSGRLAFVYFHIVWFSLWIAANLGLLGIEPFDPFPFGLLTMIVSLEAIFLATFVLISQNRMSKESEDRAELDLQINLLTEYEITRVLQMLDEIQDTMGIENDHDEELLDLQRTTKPEEVLHEIERRYQRWMKK